MSKDINEKISIPTKHGQQRRFHFCMNRHFRGKTKIVIEEIANWIVQNSKSKTAWFKNNGMKNANIKYAHKLWKLLNQRSQDELDKNYLSWIGHIYKDEQIKVTHFGPLGKDKHEEIQNAYANHMNSMKQEKQDNGNRRQNKNKQPNNKNNRSVVIDMQEIQDNYQLVGIRQNKETQKQKNKNNKMSQEQRKGISMKDCLKIIFVCLVVFVIVGIILFYSNYNF